jgi:IMP and pyridine-specific 5'-nucleotidase
VRVTPDTYRLECVPDREWKSEEMKAWREDDINEMLDNAEALLKEGAARLRLPVMILRKERAVGIIPKQATVYEVWHPTELSVLENESQTLSSV